MTAAKPSRIERSRARGWRIPPGAVYVGRPTLWGNPFIRHVSVRDGTRYVGALHPRDCTLVVWFDKPKRGDVVHYYRQWILGELEEVRGIRALTDRAVELRRRLPELRGKDLCCWCKLEWPCHADVLLELAN